MKYLISIIAVLILTVTLYAGEFTEEEKEVLEALKTQLGHWFAGEYAENAKYMHPRAVYWGTYSPIPLPDSENLRSLWKLRRDKSSEEYLGFEIVPQTVVVVGNTAILNVYLNILMKPKPDSEPVWRQNLLHNTWVKEKGGWLLLATYNTSYEE
jgi:hypothetical protein